MYNSLIKSLPAEWAHALAPVGLRIYSELFGQNQTPNWQAFSWRGLNFSNRLGIAGGVDKNADNLLDWQALGCGFLEVGTVTPNPQTSNSGQILDRDWEKQNLWNRMGFPNAGAREIAMNIYHHRPRLPLFINIGKNRSTDNLNAAKDYLACIEGLSDFADAFIINVSSPNTQSLRELQSRSHLQHLLKAITPAAKATPVLLKLSPDLPKQELHEAIDTAIDCGISGFILTNTTLSRPLNSSFPKEGGLSGKDLKVLSLQILNQSISHLGSRRKPLLIVSVGGISDTADIQERLSYGADLVQVYSSLVFQGPGFFQKIAREQISQGVA